MRKVLSFVLVLSLVLGSLGMAFAAPMSDVAGEDFEEAVNVLVDLGVVTGYPDGTYRADNIVTRAEMAVLIVNALGLGGYVGGASNFKDMAGHWSNAYVAYATALGIIDGYTDGTFRPDRTVTYAEAAKMLVAAVGFTEDSLVGTWPANYVTKAQALKILDGITASMSNGANRGDIATMVYQTLPAEIGTVDKDGKWNKNDPVETMLGRLGAVEVTTPAVIEFDMPSSINLFPYLGAFATYYEKNDKIIAVAPETVFLEGKYVASTGKFKTDDVEYIVNGTITAAALFTNGKHTAPGGGVAISTLSAGDNLVAVEVSGKTITKFHSHIVWTNPTANKFADKDAKDIKDAKLFGKSFETDTSDEIDSKLFELRGVNSLADIKKDNVVYVYFDAGDIRRVDVGTEVVEGVVTKREGTTSADYKYTVGGKAYKYSAQASRVDFEPKDEVKLFLDFNGNIFEGKKVSGKAADDYAIVLDFADTVDPLLTGNAKMKLFLADGTEKIFTVDNDDLENDFNGLLGTSVNQVTRGSIVKYSVDKDGLLNDLVTVAGVVVSKAATFTDKGYFDGKLVADDAVIFTTTTLTAIAGVHATDHEGDYGVSSLAKLKGMKDVKSLYVYDEDSKKIEFMVVEDDGIVDSDDVFAVFLKAYDDDSELGHSVELLVGEDEKTYEAKSNFTSKDDAVLYKLVFGANDTIKNLGNVPNGGDYKVAVLNTTNVSMEVDKNTLIFTTSGAFSTELSELYSNFGAGLTEVALDKDVVVYVYDDGFEVGSFSDLDFSTNSGIVVKLYDVFDKDGVVDFVIVEK